ncbi:hypothetical protein, partial [Salmonella sp. s55004]|uniref:hypothetical protein n=1 Tax=Salmonella sp. s55004 TaxID=3159675 RepID=UPI00397F4D9F
MVKNVGRRHCVIQPHDTVATLNLQDIATVTQEFPRHLHNSWSESRQVRTEFVNSGQHGFDSHRVTEEQARSSIKQANMHHYPHLSSDDPLVDRTKQEIIRQQINLDSSVLSLQERHEFYQTLDASSDVFSLYGELSSCPDFEADIILTNTDPFFIRPYRLSDNDKYTVSRELDKLVKLGILAIGHQSYTSPIMLIPKKNCEEKRVVTDFRVLNSRIRRINYPFPLLNDTLRTIGNSEATVLSVLDL